MKFIVTKTSDWSSGETEVEINSLEELLKFKANNHFPLIISQDHNGNFCLEIYDDWRE